MHRTAVKKVVLENVLDANDMLARVNRDMFDSAETYTINMMSSPGAGKTALLERTLGPDHPNLAATLDNYADLLRKMQREAEAESAAARAKAIWAKQKREPGGKQD